MEYRFKAMEMWYRQLPGSLLVDVESTRLKRLLLKLQGDFLLQIGGPSDLSLVRSSPITHKVYLSSQQGFVSDRSCIKGDLEALPLLPESIDVIIVSHMLEFIEHPQEFLRAVYQVLAPNGRLIVLGFNPWSLWGLTRLNRAKKGFPWQGNFYPAKQVKRWLQKRAFDLCVSQSVCFRPPLQHSRQCRRWLFLEALGPLLLPGCGAAYMIMARKRVVGMTPAKEHWWEKKLAVNNGYAEPTTRSSHYEQN